MAPGHMVNVGMVRGTRASPSVVLVHVRDEPSRPLDSSSFSPSPLHLPLLSLSSSPLPPFPPPALLLSLSSSSPSPRFPLLFSLSQCVQVGRIKIILVGIPTICPKRAQEWSSLGRFSQQKSSFLVEASQVCSLGCSFSEQSL